MLRRVVEVEDVVAGITSLCPVTNMYDRNGHSTKDPIQAVTFVAKLDGGLWLSCEVCGMTIQTIQ